MQRLLMNAALKQFLKKSINNRFTLRSLSTSLSSNDDPSLMKEISMQIKINGPLTVNDYMRLSLTHPKYGFYMKQDVFGAKGHFITSPEVSQIFGELIAIWIMYQWQQYSNGRQLDIIELGPGRGTLCKDIARSFSQFSSTRNELSDCRFHLIEISPFLQRKQHENLCNVELIENSDDNGVKSSKTLYDQRIYWYETIDQFKLFNSSNYGQRFPVFIANEFFDAFPIHKFVRNEQQPHKWNELLIDYDEHEKCLRWVKSKHETVMTKLLSSNGYFDRYRSMNESIKNLEYCPQLYITIDKIIDYIQKQSNNNNNNNDSIIFGCLLICDYGFDDYNEDNNSHNNSTKSINDHDTFRSYYQHKQCDPLTNVGMADLTADIHFNEIRQHLRRVQQQQPNYSNVKINCFGAVEQRIFLQQMGILFRLKQLLQQYSNDKRIQKQLIDSVNMLMNDNQMGERFKFMSIFISNNDDHNDIFENAGKPVGFM